MAQQPFALVDLHSHLVPAVDDGTATIEESLESLRFLRAQGVAALVTTPHLLLPQLDTYAAVERVLDGQRRAFDLLKEFLTSTDDLPEVALGQEIWAPDATTIRRALGIPGLGLGGTRYLLVEFGFDLTGRHLDVIEEVLAAGHRIIIAHPERYRFAPGDDPLEVAAEWCERGALLQLNAGSLTGHYVDHRPDSKRLAWALVESGLAGLIASDHHGVRRRGGSPSEAHAALCQEGRHADARRLLGTVPWRVWRDDLVFEEEEAVATPQEP